MLLWRWSKNKILLLLNENPLVSQCDVARSFSLRYDRTLSKSVVSKTKFREVTIRFPAFEEYMYVTSELRGSRQKKGKVGTRRYATNIYTVIDSLQAPLLPWSKKVRQASLVLLHDLHDDYLWPNRLKRSAWSELIAVGYWRYPQP